MEVPLELSTNETPKFQSNRTKTQGIWLEITNYKNFWQIAGNDLGDVFEWFRIQQSVTTSRPVSTDSDISNIFHHWKIMNFVEEVEKQFPKNYSIGETDDCNQVQTDGSI